MLSNNIKIYDNFIQFLIIFLALWRTAILYIIQLRAVEVNHAFETDYWLVLAK